MSRIRFDGQAVVVTGGGNGLGKAYALDLAARGAAVVVNDLGCTLDGSGASQGAADQVVEQIRQGGGSAVASYDSVATPAGGDRIIQIAMDQFGRVDAVINNAGNLRNALFDELPDEDVDELLNVHVKGTAYVSRAAFRIMKQQRYGRFVFVASAAALFGNPAQAAYAAAKGGAMGLMNVVALEGHPHGILANGVLPAAFSRMVEAMDPAYLEDFGKIAARFGNAVAPEFVTPVTTYLASRECETTHGLYSAAGGRFARVFVGASAGWHGPRDVPASAEDIAEHFAQIEDRSAWCEPLSLADEFMNIAAALRPSS